MVVVDKKTKVQLVLQDLQKNDVFPVGALLAAHSVQDEIAPFLMEMLSKDYEAVKNNSEDDVSVSSFYGLYLLSEFRYKPLYPLLLKIFRLTEDQLDVLLGDALTEGLARMTAAIFSGPYQVLFEIFDDKNLYEFARKEALNTILILFIHDKIDHISVISDIEKRLKEAIIEQNVDDVTELVDFVLQARINSLYSLAYQAFDDDLIDIMFYDIQFFNEACHTPIEKEYKFYNFIDNAYGELRFFASFRELPNIGLGDSAINKGRNDTCLCFSGKKLKKCCLSLIQ